MSSMNTRLMLLSSAAAVCIAVPRTADAAEPNRPAESAEADLQSEQTSSPQSNNDAKRSEPDADIGDIIVTAQKRAQTVNDVPLSITAISGDQLTSRGISDPTQLTKLVSGFTYNETATANPVYTIRGVGYQDSSIASSPAVTVYVDEVPLPYSGATLGAALDVERVEVLKGPQGTLYGGNSTGGAINYIAAKPTKTLSAGANWEFGRFSTSNLSAFVSGPVSETLSLRLAGRWVKSGSWQRSYTRDDSLGRKDQLFGRLLADWRPADNLKIQLSFDGWRDHSESQAGQLIAIQQTVPGVPLDPRFQTYPLAPQNARAADWDPDRDYRRRSSLRQVSGRIDYTVTDVLTLTSISSYQVYKRFDPVDLDATDTKSNFSTSSGKVRTFFQEVRANAAIARDFNITAGANYQSDKIDEMGRVDLPINSARVIAGNGFINDNRQDVKSKGVFASVDFPIIAGLTGVAGVRYSKVDRDYVGCTKDNGDGTAAAAFSALTGVNAVPGECFTIQANGLPGAFVDSLNEGSTSWRAGLNYKPAPDVLLYGNVSRGFKAGAYQSLAAATFVPLRPVVQERLTAYEVGFKAGILDGLLQLNGAAFYYDYANKQIRGIIIDPAFGTNEALVNIPKSRVQGFELSATVRPLRGLSVASSITMVDSEVRGSFIGVSPASEISDFDGQAFPYTPKWSGQTDAEYRWNLGGDLVAVAGGTVTYRSETNGGFGENQTYRVRGFTLLDLRAEIEGNGGAWRAGIWGRNVTNQYYWHTATRASDTGTRFAGMPATYGISLAFRY